MKLEVRVPQLSESVATGTLLAWRKQLGDQLARDETLVDLETDKVILEIPVPASGTLLEIRQPEGAVVKAGEVIAVMETGETVAIDSAVVANEGKPSRVPGEPLPAGSPRPVFLASSKMADASMRPRDDGGAKGPPEPQHAAPSVPLQVAPAVSVAAPGGVPLPNPRQWGWAHPHPPLPLAGEGGVREAGEGANVLPTPIKREPMSRLRQRVAERLVAAQHTAAMLTTFNEVNMQPVNELRQRYKAEFETRHGVKLGYMSFFVRAVCVALEQFPILNAAIDGEDIVWHDSIDMGIAISSPRGLVVPVLRNAQQKTAAEIEAAIADFAHRAREVRLTLEDLAGGTFSITNGGVFGSLLSTPILNPPQSAILGMHKIQERPVAENGQVVIRPMMYLALTYDHRLIDGRDAVQFLVELKALLEAPERLLPGM
jgi:2-oxoglutarate dehydrogenase E2 component (dihydrolipoamide succinyltransferase)